MGVVTRQPPVLGSNPERTRAVQVHRLDERIAQAARIIRISAVNPKGIAVVAVEAILGAQPEVALRILKEAGNDARGKPFFRSDPFKTQ